MNEIYYKIKNNSNNKRNWNIIIANPLNSRFIYHFMLYLIIVLNECKEYKEIF